MLDRLIVMDFVRLLLILIHLFNILLLRCAADRMKDVSLELVRTRGQVSAIEAMECERSDRVARDSAEEARQSIARSIHARAADDGRLYFFLTIFTY